MDPYIVALVIFVWLGLAAGIVALFIGRDRMITDLKHAWAEAEREGRE